MSTVDTHWTVTEFHGTVCLTEIMGWDVIVFSVFIKVLRSISPFDKTIYGNK